MNDLTKSTDTAGRYRVIRELGTGATGRVFLAERVEDFKQQVVLKVLRWAPITNSSHEPIGGEHVILRSLEHPNIVTLLDQGRMADGAPFLVLEYLDGTTIDAWCDTHRLSVQKRLTLLEQVFSAVSYAHSRLVLHGDIKPANIMVTHAPAEAGTPIVKLLDFGLSHWLHEGRSGPGATGATLAYASPEQRRGDALTVAADVYALGVLMSYLLSGSEPLPLDSRKSRMSAYFRGLNPARQQKLAGCRNTTPHSLGQLLHGPLDAIVEKATASAPEDRYVSVAAMTEDVNRYMGDMETSVYPLASPQQTALWMRRHAWLASLTATMFAILLIGGSLTLWRHHRVVAQARETHARLLELARLTDELGGTLYRSTESLAGTEKARVSLLHAASTARDAVAKESTDDPELSLELARQYVAAAELELAQNDKEATQHAKNAIDSAKALLNNVPDTQLRSETEERIKILQARVGSS